MADGGHLEKMVAQKIVCVISFEPLVCSHSNLMWWFSGYI